METWMIIITEQLTQWLIGIVVFFSPPLNIYLMAKLAKTKAQKMIVITVGIGSYVLYIFLVAMWIFYEI